MLTRTAMWCRGRRSLHQVMSNYSSRSQRLRSLGMSLHSSDPVSFLKLFWCEVSVREYRSSAAYRLALPELGGVCLLPHGFPMRPSGGESSQDGQRSYLLLSRPHCGLDLWDQPCCDGETILWHLCAMWLSVLTLCQFCWEILQRV